MIFEPCYLLIEDEGHSTRYHMAYCEMFSQVIAEESRAAQHARDNASEKEKTVPNDHTRRKTSLPQNENVICDTDPC